MLQNRQNVKSFAMPKSKINTKANLFFVSFYFIVKHQKSFSLKIILPPKRILS